MQTSDKQSVYRSRRHVVFTAQPDLPRMDSCQVLWGRQHVTRTGRALWRLTNYLCFSSVSDVIIMVHRFNTTPCRWFTVPAQCRFRNLVLARRLMGHRNTHWEFLNVNPVVSECLIIWWCKQIWPWLFTHGDNRGWHPTMSVVVLNVNSLSRVSAGHFVCPSMLIMVKFLWVAVLLQLLVDEVVIVTCVGDSGWY